MSYLEQDGRPFDERVVLQRISRITSLAPAFEKAVEEIADVLKAQAGAKVVRVYPHSRGTASGMEHQDEEIEAVFNQVEFRYRFLQSSGSLLRTPD